jgi:hypothetical protein
VRRRKSDLTARVNGNLQLEFGNIALTSYAGLELFRQYLRSMQFNKLVREAFSGTAGWTDFGVVGIVRLLIGLIVVGGHRLRHLAYLEKDPLFERFCGLRHLPTARTVGRWLRQFTMQTVGRLQLLNAAVIAHVLPGLALRTLTVDIDGVVVLTKCRIFQCDVVITTEHKNDESNPPQNCVQRMRKELCRHLMEEATVYPRVGFLAKDTRLS